MEGRNIQKMFKVSLTENEELQRIMKKEGLSLSDLIRKAIQQVYLSEGFELSYEISAKRDIKRKRKWELF